MYESTSDWGAKATEQLLCLDPSPTAIFACNSRLLTGAMTVINHRKIKIPDELSVISFDRPEWLSILRSRITLIDLPANELAAKAVQMLLQRIRGNESDIPPTTYRVKVSLVEGDSCRQVNTQSLSLKG